VTSDLKLCAQSKSDLALGFRTGFLSPRHHRIIFWGIKKQLKYSELLKNVEADTD